MNLDFPTLAVVGFVLSIGLAVAFSLLLLVLRGQPVLRLWTASLWLGAASLTLVAQRPHMPTLLSILAGNACAALGAVLLLAGVALHVGHRGTVYRPALLLAAAYLGAIAYFSVLRPDLGARLALYGLASVIWDLWAIRLLLHRTPRDIRISCRLAAAAFAADALLYLTRLFMPVAPNADQDIMHAGLPVQVTYVIGTLLVLAQCFALVLLIVERQMVDLRSMARHDGLTGLANRATLLFEGRRLLERCRRRGSPLAVLMLDLDHFKQINDTCGHAAGDEVLRSAARRLRTALAGRPGVLARYGGEEFAAVLPDTALPEALLRAEALRAALDAHPIAIEAASLRVTLSIGVALAAPGDASLDAALARADAALYEAKAGGRNRVTVDADADADADAAGDAAVAGM